MAHPYWPLFDLRVSTPRLELRLPSDDELVALAGVAATGIHDAADMPFGVPWTDAPSPQLERDALQFWWRQRADWKPDRWNYNAGVFVDGEPVGFQDIGASSFALLRTVTTGSWLGRAHQGRGIGKEMRAAILHLAFAGLGAAAANSGAWHDNGPSLGVSRALGYVENGKFLLARRDRADWQIGLRLDRSTWEARRRDDIVIEGLEPCLELFGVEGGKLTGLPTLSTQELNRALLARQLLLGRATEPVPGALELMGGLQAQYAPSMYIGLWSRVAGFQREDLTRGLAERTVVQGTLLRVTIHLVSRADYWPLAIAVRSARQKWWLRAGPRGVTPAEMEAGAARLRARLDEGPIRRTELDALLGKPQSTGVGLWIDLVRVPPSGTWERRRADLYAAAEDWLGPPEVDHDTAMELLVRRYLTGFGPSTAGELADWAGLSIGDVTPVLRRLDLDRYQAEDGSELYDLASAPLPDRETPAPARFLGTWDAMLLVHARRKAVLPEEFRPRVFSVKTPQSVPTFLVDGAVAGTWKYQAGAVRLNPFAPLPKSTMRDLEAEAERLAAFHA